MRLTAGMIALQLMLNNGSSMQQYLKKISLLLSNMEQTNANFPATPSLKGENFILETHAHFHSGSRNKRNPRFIIIGIPASFRQCKVITIS